MAAVASRIERHTQDVVNRQDHLAVKTTTYAMTVRDLLVKADTSAGAWTLTLPPVHECMGIVRTIKMTAGAGSGAAPNALTITHNGDSSYWNGNILLRRPGQMAMFLSDGEQWHLTRIMDGAPISGNQLDAYMHEMFLLPVNMCAKGVVDLGDIVTGVTGDENVLFCGSGNILEQHVLVTQTLTGPIWSDPGLNISQDLTDNDGIEWSTGIGANARHRFTVGTSPAFFVRARITIADVTGTDDFLVGFRKLEAYQALVDGYDEMAAFQIALGVINTETIINAAATVTTDTTLADWADAETHTVEVRVSAAGVVTYLYDDAAPTVVAAFTFDDAEEVIPFIYLKHATTSPGAVTILEFECGPQA